DSRCPPGPEGWRTPNEARSTKGIRIAGALQLVVGASWSEPQASWSRVFQHCLQSRNEIGNRHLVLQSWNIGTRPDHAPISNRKHEPANRTVSFRISLPSQHRDILLAWCIWRVFGKLHESHSASQCCLHR